MYADAADRGAAVTLPTDRPHHAGLRTGALLFAALGAPTAASASDAIKTSLVYQADLVSIWSDSVNGRAVALDSLHFAGDADLSHAGLDGGSVHFDLNSTSGGAPNNSAGALQGLDNIEVARPRLRLYEFWYEQGIADGRASFRVGLQELNEEFGATDASSLLVNPSFGLAPEIAATGTNGPSTFPSTALAARVRIAAPSGFDVRFAAFNALAAAPNDPGGTDYGFSSGVLVIGEATWRKWGVVSLGAWRYSDRQDDLRDTDAAGAPVPRRSEGAYALAEKSLAGVENEARHTTAFVRAGVSDGDTTPLAGSWQAGLTVERPFTKREDSLLSVGVTQALTSANYRLNERDAGINAGGGETVIELTYSDTIGPRLTLQPDIQLALDPGADRARESAVVAGLRVTIQPWGL